MVRSAIHHCQGEKPRRTASSRGRGRRRPRARRSARWAIHARCDETRGTRTRASEARLTKRAVHGLEIAPEPIGSTSIRSSNVHDALVLTTTRPSSLDGSRSALAATCWDAIGTQRAPIWCILRPPMPPPMPPIGGARERNGAPPVTELKAATGLTRFTRLDYFFRRASEPRSSPPRAAALHSKACPAPLGELTR